MFYYKGSFITHETYAFYNFLKCKNGEGCLHSMNVLAFFLTSLTGDTTRVLIFL
jgi:hypothetical protein